MSNTTRAILDSYRITEKLKREMRHSWLSDGRRESVAEHTWNMAILALLAHSHLQHPVSLERSLKLIIVHDLPEAEAGDIPFFEVSDRRKEKAAREQAAMDQIEAILPAPAGAEIAKLWREFEDGQTAEAKFARALDHLEVQLQHNLAEFSTWTEIEYELVYTKMDQHCEHDAFLQSLCDAVKLEAESKLLQHGIDVAAVKVKVAAQCRQSASA